MRMVSIVWAVTRKCHARRPKKLRCSMTEASMFPALTAYFENKIRYWRISPGRNGTEAAAGAAGAAGALARGLGRLDCCAELHDEHTRVATSSVVAQAIQASFED